MKPVEAWLGAQTPEAPMSLAPWLAGDDDVQASLLLCAVAALREAEARPGRVRQAAFDLLAADALLTYACAAALEADDPEAALSEVLAAAVGT